MSKKNYLEPNFYVVSDRLCYTIRGEVELGEVVDGDCLQKAVDTAFTRFPYFSVQVVIKDNKFNIDPNPRPHVILHTPDQITLGTSEVNYHLVVISYYENRIFFNVSHSITDGAGRAPLTRTVLYYYFCNRYPDAYLDPEGIYLAGTESFVDERSTPVTWDDVKDAEPTYFKTPGKAFNLGEKDIIKDNVQTEYRFMIDEKEFMKLNKSQDASPSVLASALLAEMTWKLHPEIDENIVINLCMNMRPGLANKHSHLPLFTAIPLQCKPSMKDFPLDKICTSMRGMVMLQSQPENVRYIYKRNLEAFNQLHEIPDIKTRMELTTQGLYAENGLLAVTFITSYVGRSDLGCLSPYVKAMFTTVDAIPKDGIIIEISSADGKYFTFMQDFSTDVYVKTFTDLIRERGLTVSKLGSRPILAPKIELPEF